MRVSIIIPAYNPGRFLCETLKSVMRQTFQEWECFVIDDGSDEDLSWIDAFEPRVRRIRQENGGLSAARNRGLDESDGDFVAFLDADDVWLPGKLQAQVDALEQAPGAVLSHTRMRLIDERGVVTGPGWVRPIRSYAELVADSRICVSSVMARREAVVQAGGFDRALRSTQDFGLWLALAKQGDFVFHDQDMVEYRVHGGNMSGNAWVMGKEVNWLLRREARWLQSEGRDELSAVALRARRLALNGWGAAAFDCARIHWGKREYWGVLRQAYFATRLAPRYVVSQCWSKLFPNQRVIVKGGG